MDSLIKLINESKIIIVTLVSIITFTIGVYESYNSLVADVRNNAKQLELTQMMILKPLVRIAEDNKNRVSDAEWDEYILNYTTLYNLKVKHGIIPKSAIWMPVERIK